MIKFEIYFDIIVTSFLSNILAIHTKLFVAALYGYWMCCTTFEMKSIFGIYASIVSSGY